MLNEESLFYIMSDYGPGNAYQAIPSYSLLCIIYWDFDLLSRA